MEKLFTKFKSLLTNEFTYMGSDILIKAIAFITLPFFVNIMSTAEFGEFSLYQTYVSVFCIFFGVNINQGIVRYYIEKENQKKYISTALWINLAFGVFFSAIVILAEYLLKPFNISFKILYAICIGSIFNGIVNIGLENLRAMFKAKLYSLYSLLSSVISTLLGLALVYNMKSDLGYWRLMSTIISTVAIGMLLSIGIVKRDGFSFNKDTARYLLAYSIPLIPYTLSTTIISQINRVFLAGIGMSEVGIYSFATNLAMIIYIIALSLNRAYQPFLYKSLKDNSNYRSKMFENIILFYVFYVGFIFFNDILIWIFGNKEYSAAANVIPVIVLGYGFFFLHSLIVNYFYYYGKNFIISIFSIISAIIILVFNSILIPRYGYYGAAWSTVISYFSLTAVGYLYLKKYLHIQVLKIKEILLILILFILPAIIKISVRFIF